MTDSYVAELDAALGIPEADWSAAERAAEAADITFDIVSDRAGFLALQEDWDALFEQSARSHQLFQSFNWLRHWCRHYVWADRVEAAPRLCIVVGRTQGRVSMMWPLVRGPMFGMSRITWMGDPVSQYGDVLVEDGPHAPALLEAGWRHVRESLHGDAIVLRKVRDDGALAPLLRRLGVAVTDEERAPFADLTDSRSFQDYQTRFSKKLRRNRRRQRNRLAEIGEIGFEILEDGEAARQAVGEAMGMKRRWLKDRGLIAPAFKDKRIDAFFADAVTTGAEGCGALVSVLRVADRPVAIEIGLLCKGRYVSHVGAFDLEHAKLSPGTLQMEETLRHCIEERGARCHDLLAPDGDYKASWADGAVGVRDYVATRTPMGRLYASAYLRKIRPGLKDGLARLPSFMTRLVPQA